MTPKEGIHEKMEKEYNKWSKLTKERYDIIYNATNFLYTNGFGDINFDDLSEGIVREINEDEFKRALIEVIYKHMDNK